jgi:hypothetical protein
MEDVTTVLHVFTQEEGMKVSVDFNSLLSLEGIVAPLATVFAHYPEILGVVESAVRVAKGIDADELSRDSSLGDLLGGMGIDL